MRCNQNILIETQVFLMILMFEFNLVFLIDKSLLPMSLESLRIYMYKFLDHLHRDSAACNWQWVESSSHLLILHIFSYVSNKIFPPRIGHYEDSFRIFQESSSGYIHLVHSLLASILLRK